MGAVLAADIREVYEMTNPNTIIFWVFVLLFFAVLPVLAKMLAWVAEGFAELWQILKK
jgi:hypothetical protein